MDPRMIPKGSSSEYNYGEQDGKARPNEPGVYYHPAAGKFIETTGTKRPDGSMAYAQDTGKIQADAFKQIGYRPATPEEASHHRNEQAKHAEAMNAKSKSTTHVISSRGRS